MFIEARGPTALRSELVQALSLSVDVVEISGPGGPGRFCAALSGVWNGSKGYVAVLLRQVEEPRVRRFVHEQPIRSERALCAAIDEGIAFAESMGFSLDHPEFRELSEEEQKQRLSFWDDLRKPKRAIQHLDLAAEPRPGSAPDPYSISGRTGVDPEAEDEGPDPFAGWDSESGSERDPDPGKAVLGRLHLVRKGEAAHPLAFLLSHF